MPSKQGSQSEASKVHAETKTVYELLHFISSPVFVIQTFLGQIKDLAMDEKQRGLYEGALRACEKIVRRIK